MGEKDVRPEFIEAPADRVISIYNRRFDGYIHVHPDGYVELTSPAGTVLARFRELEKTDWLRESYIRMLIESGADADSIAEALQAIEHVDKRLQGRDREAERTSLVERSAAAFQRWCEEHGIRHEELTESEVADLVTRGIQSVRGRYGVADDE